MRSGFRAVRCVLQAALSRGLLASVLIPLTTSGLVAGNLYRMTDERGNVVYTDQLPPEQVKKGYGVLDREGRETQQILRAPTAEERAEAARRLEAQAKAERELEEQMRRESLLLQLYGSEEAVNSALDASLQPSESKRKLLELSLSSTKKRIELLRAEEAQGKSHTNELVLARKQLTADEIALQNVDKERDAVIEHYAQVLQSWKSARTRWNLLYPKVQPSGTPPAVDPLLSPPPSPRPQTGEKGKD
jgi:hypothetical protein